MPASKANLRERAPETPSHAGGLSDIARQRLEERRRTRDQPHGKFVRQRHALPCPVLTISPTGDGGISSQSRKEPAPDAPQGLGDFKRRSNRAERDRDNNRRDNNSQQSQFNRPRDSGYQNRNGNGTTANGPPRGWTDATPKATPRGRDDAPSVRVPNVAWDSTPRSQASGSGWGAARDRRWDAPTPRAGRGEDDDDDGRSVAGGREWEEEQIKLDRDWYMGAEGSAVRI